MPLVKCGLVALSSRVEEIWGASMSSTLRVPVGKLERANRYQTTSDSVIVGFVWVYNYSSKPRNDAHCLRLNFNVSKLDY